MTTKKSAAKGSKIVKDAGKKGLIRSKIKAGQKICGFLKI
jgi:hypothetical protein